MNASRMNAAIITIGLSCLTVVPPLAMAQVKVGIDSPAVQAKIQAARAAALAKFSATELTQQPADFPLPPYPAGSCSMWHCMRTTRGTATTTSISFISKEMPGDAFHFYQNALNGWQIILPKDSAKQQLSGVFMLKAKKDNVIVNLSCAQTGSKKLTMVIVCATH